MQQIFHCFFLADDNFELLEEIGELIDVGVGGGREGSFFVVTHKTKRLLFFSSTALVVYFSLGAVVSMVLVSLEISQGFVLLLFSFFLLVRVSVVRCVGALAGATSSQSGGAGREGREEEKEEKEEEEEEEEDHLPGVVLMIGILYYSLIQYESVSYIFFASWFYYLFFFVTQQQKNVSHGPQHGVN